MHLKNPLEALTGMLLQSLKLLYQGIVLKDISLINKDLYYNMLLISNDLLIQNRAY